MTSNNTINVLSAEATTIADALRTIDRDHSEQVDAINKAHKAKRAELVSELAGLNRALRALKAPVVGVTASGTTGKPLSPEHRQKIKDALQRRAAAKAAAATSPTLALIAPAAAAPQAIEEHDSAVPTKRAAKKAVARG